MKQKLVLNALLALTINQNLHALTLSEANELALRNAPSWKAAQEKYQAQKEDVSIAESNSRTQVDLNGSHIENYDLGTSENYSNSSLSLDLRKSLINKSLQSKIQRAQTVKEINEVELEIKKQDELAKVTTAYLDALKKKELYKLAQEEVNVLQKQLDRSDKSLQAGLANKNQVLDAKAQLDAAKANLLSADMELNNSILNLETLTQSDVKTLETNLVLKPDVVNKVESSRSYWNELAQKHNLNLKKSRLIVRAAEYNVSEKTNLKKLTVDGIASIGVRRDETATDGSQNRGQDGVISVGVQMKFPVKSNGLNEALTAQAYAEKNASLSELQAQSLISTQAVNSLVSSLKIDVKIIDSKRKSVSSSSEALRATYAQYNSGLLNSLDVVTAHKNLYAAKKDLVSAKYEAAGRVLKLLEVSGQLSLTTIEKIEKDVLD